MIRVFIRVSLDINNFVDSATFNITQNLFITNFTQVDRWIYIFQRIVVFSIYIAPRVDTTLTDYGLGAWRVQAVRHQSGGGICGKIKAGVKSRPCLMRSALSGMA